MVMLLDVAIPSSTFSTLYPREFLKNANHSILIFCLKTHKGVPFEIKLLKGCKVLGGTSTCKALREEL